MFSGGLRGVLVVLLVILTAAAAEESHGQGGAASEYRPEDLPPECGVKLPKAKKQSADADAGDNGVEADDGTDGDDDDDDDDEEAGPECVVLPKSDPIDGDEPPPEIDQDAKDDNDTDTSDGTYNDLPRQPRGLTRL